MNKRILSGTELDICKRGLCGCRESLETASKALTILMEEEGRREVREAIARAANAISLAKDHAAKVRRYIGDPATRNGPERLR